MISFVCKQDVHFVENSNYYYYLLNLAVFVVILAKKVLTIYKLSFTGGESVIWQCNVVLNNIVLHCSVDIQ